MVIHLVLLFFDEFRKITLKFIVFHTFFQYVDRIHHNQHCSLLFCSFVYMIYEQIRSHLQGVHVSNKYVNSKEKKA